MKEIENRLGKVETSVGKLETSIGWMYKIGAVIGAGVLGVLAWIGSLISTIIENWGSIPVL